MPTPPPPKEHRWKKGQSGNPKGRPRNRERFETLLKREIGQFGRDNLDGMKDLSDDEVLARAFAMFFWDRSSRAYARIAVELLARLWPLVQEQNITASLSIERADEYRAEILDRIRRIKAVTGTGESPRRRIGRGNSSPKK